MPIGINVVLKGSNKISFWVEFTIDCLNQLCLGNKITPVNSKLLSSIKGIKN